MWIIMSTLQKSSEEDGGVNPCSTHHHHKHGLSSCSTHCHYKHEPASCSAQQDHQHRPASSSGSSTWACLRPNLPPGCVKDSRWDFRPFAHTRLSTRSTQIIKQKHPRLSTYSKLSARSTSDYQQESLLNRFWFELFSSLLGSSPIGIKKSKIQFRYILNYMIKVQKTN